MTATACYPDGSDVHEGDLVHILSVVRFGVGIVRAVLLPAPDRTVVVVEKRNGEFVGYASYGEARRVDGLRLMARNGAAALNEETTP